MARLEAIKCKQCDGEMGVKTIARHSQGGAAILLFGGIILCFTGVGAIVGVPLILLGLFFGCGSKKYWVCKQCGTKIERI